MDRALNMRPGENSAELKNGVSDQWAPFLPWAMATTARTTKRPRITISPKRKARLAQAVILMPARFTTVLNTTKMMIQTDWGTTVARATAPVT
ncbi:MAG TPA: hypothetical protein VGR06_35030 [Actinophytocola sp.]|nr:hypothetical protein [Actinophytocola sp.]